MRRRVIAAALAVAAAGAFALELRLAVECDVPGVARTALFFLPAALAGCASVVAVPRGLLLAPAVASAVLLGTWIGAALVYLNYAGCD